MAPFVDESAPLTGAPNASKSRAYWPVVVGLLGLTLLAGAGVAFRAQADKSPIAEEKVYKLDTCMSSGYDGLDQDKCGRFAFNHRACSADNVDGAGCVGPSKCAENPRCMPQGCVFDKRSQVFYFNEDKPAEDCREFGCGIMETCSMMPNTGGVYWASFGRFYGELNMADPFANKTSVIKGVLAQSPDAGKGIPAPDPAAAAGAPAPSRRLLDDGSSFDTQHESAPKGASDTFFDDNQNLAKLSAAKTCPEQNLDGITKTQCTNLANSFVKTTVPNGCKPKLEGCYVQFGEPMAGTSKNGLRLAWVDSKDTGDGEGCPEDLQQVCSTCPKAGAIHWQVINTCLNEEATIGPRDTPPAPKATGTADEPQEGTCESMMNMVDQTKGLCEAQAQALLGCSGDPDTNCLLEPPCKECAARGCTWDAEDNKFYYQEHFPNDVPTGGCGRSDKPECNKLINVCNLCSNKGMPQTWKDTLGCLCTLRGNMGDPVSKFMLQMKAGQAPDQPQTPAPMVNGRRAWARGMAKGQAPAAPVTSWAFSECEGTYQDGLETPIVDAV